MHHRWPLLPLCLCRRCRRVKCTQPAGLDGFLVIPLSCLTMEFRRIGALWELTKWGIRPRFETLSITVIRLLGRENNILLGRAPLIYDTSGAVGFSSNKTKVQKTKFMNKNKRNTKIPVSRQQMFKINLPGPHADMAH